MQQTISRARIRRQKSGGRATILVFKTLIKAGKTNFSWESQQTFWYLLSILKIGQNTFEPLISSQTRLESMESNHLEPPYLSGFGNEFTSEAIGGALPSTQNSPQRCPFNLYAEQISGTSFTMPRGQNFRSWLYKISPSVLHEPFEPMQQIPDLISDFSAISGDPNQVLQTSNLAIKFISEFIGTDAMGPSAISKKQC